MASVSSLDKDLRNLRLGRYTPEAAQEVRSWIEEILGERLVPGDLLNALKDGIALCKYDDPAGTWSSMLGWLIRILDLSTLLSVHLVYASSSLLCHSYKWRISLIFSALANPPL